MSTWKAVELRQGERNEAQDRSRAMQKRARPSWQDGPGVKGLRQKRKLSSVLVFHACKRAREGNCWRSKLEGVIGG